MALPISHQALLRWGTALVIQPVLTEPPHAGGLLIAIDYAGVCGTDLQILNGTRPDTAEILGHEGVGTVAQAGEGAKMRPGDRVVFNPVAQISANRLLGHNVSGLFQKYLSVGADAVDSGLVLPACDFSPPICGALTEPLGAIIYARELLRGAVPHLRTAAVFGAGPIGLLATQLLGASGTKVFLVHPSQTRLNTAFEVGLLATSTPLVVSADLPERLISLNAGRRLDAALICTTRQGAPLALRHALAAVEDGGCIDLVTNFPEHGAVPDGLDIDSIRSVRAANVCGVPREGSYLHTDISGRRIAITGHRGTSADHLNAAMRELDTRAKSYRKLITHVLSLSSAANDIAVLANSGERSLHGSDCIKAVIDLTN